jgi:hypothetical protein
VAESNGNGNSPLRALGAVVGILVAIGAMTNGIYSILSERINVVQTAAAANKDDVQHEIANLYTKLKLELTGLDRVVHVELENVKQALASTNEKVQLEINAVDSRSADRASQLKDEFIKLDEKLQMEIAHVDEKGRLYVDSVLHPRPDGRVHPARNSAGAD